MRSLFPAVPFDAAAAARLDRLRQAPESAGALIYRGLVFAPDAPAGDGAPLFRYERRVEGREGGFVAAHVTTDPSGEVIIAERATLTADYQLQRFEADNRQQGYTGSVELGDHGRRLEYRLVAGGRTSRAVERVADPVVSGPSLHGFILRRWAALARGEVLPVRMIVLREKTSYGFRIRRLGEAGGQTTFSITPSHWLVRLAIAPLFVRFDAVTRNVLRYEGRVPPMQPRRGRLATLDARVDYTMHVPAYR